MTTWPDKKIPDLDVSEKKTLGKGVFRKFDVEAAMADHAGVMKRIYAKTV